MEIVPGLDLTDAQFASALALVRREEERFDPGFEPVTADELRLLIADDRTEGNRHIRSAAMEGDVARAFGHLDIELDDNNLHMVSTELFGAAGDPDAGRALLAAFLDIAETDNRTTLLGWGAFTDEEKAFWESLGAPLRYTERMSALDVRAVDAEMMQAWVDQRMERAADVTLVHFGDHCPDELLESYAESRAAMNDIPLDDIEMNAWTIDTDDVREEEDAHRALGHVAINTFAIDPDGGPVGHTTLHINPMRPDASWQWDTVVLERHRNRGVGRWLKAAMWQRLREEFPEVGRLMTGNAESNDPMLAINVAMGFTERQVYGAWQTDIATLRANL